MKSRKMVVYRKWILCKKPKVVYIMYLNAKQREGPLRSPASRLVPSFHDFCSAQEERFLGGHVPLVAFVGPLASR